jgi:DNA polymerase-3 subunit delta'
MSFKDIKGQNKAIEVLKEHIKNSRLAASYLFSGPESVGKKTLAITLAKAINCQEDLFDSCDKCPSCLKIDKGQHPDIHIIDASTPINFNNSDAGDSNAVRIAHIRQLQKDISLRPYEAKVKVFIIDNAHNLTAEASNALLKILEEPPKNSLIILVSAKPALLFKTIISRCRTLKFYPLKRPELECALTDDYALDKDAAHFLAYFCDGRIGEALKLKDADVMIEKNRVIDDFVFSPSFRFENMPTPNRDAVRKYLNILSSWFRDIYLIKIGAPHSELINYDRKAQVLKSMQHFSFLDLEQIFGIISDSALHLDDNINIKLLLADLRMELWRG